VTQTKLAQCEISFSERGEDTLLVRIAGNWKIGQELPSANELLKELESRPGIQRVAFDASNLTGWDSGLLTFLTKAIDHCNQREVYVDKEGLPQGVQRLLALASAVPEKKEAKREVERETFLSRVGSETINFFRSAGEMLGFIGESSVAFGRLLTGKASYRRSDLTPSLS
jgi:phospholipid/cholesterol/gamma-HCH transport system permease protein